MTMRNYEMKFALSMRHGIAGLLRFSLYVLLILIGRILRVITGLGAIFGLLVFLHCALFQRDLYTPMLAGAGLAISAVVINIGYTALLRLVAPEDTVFVDEV
jgi:hypothetical protein